MKHKWFRYGTASIILLLLSLLAVALPMEQPVQASGTWSAMSSGTTVTLWGIWGSSASDVYAVGSSGVIRHYDGSTWSSMSSGTTVTLWGIWGSSASDIYAVGDSGTIRHYNGSTWSSMSSGTSNSLYGVWGSSASDIYAVGFSGAILHYNGSTWSTMSSGTSNSLHGVWGSSASDIYAVGDNYTILHYDGSSWSTITTNTTTNPIEDVWGSSSSDVYAVGSSGTILHYNGSTWSTMSSGTSYPLYGIWGSSASDVYAVGGITQSNPLTMQQTYTSIILHYNGSSWSTVSNAASYILFGIWGSSASSIMTIGSSGTILQYSNYSADHFTVAGIPDPVVAGAPSDVTVTADNQSNTAMTGYNGTIHFTSTDSGSSTTLPGDYTFTAGDNGVHTFTGGVTLTTAGSQTITVKDTANTSATGMETVTVDPGPLDHYLVSNVSATQIAGNIFNVTIQAQDKYDNDIVTGNGSEENVAISFGVSDAGATPTSVTTSGGKATVSLKLTKGTTGQTIIFTGAASGKSGTSNSFDVNAGTLDHINVSPSGPSVAVNSTQDFTAQGQDRYNNNIGGLSYSWSCTDTIAGSIGSSSGVFTAGTSVNAFTDVIQVTSNSVTGNASVTVTPGTAVNFTVSGYPSSVTVGTSHTFSVTAKDAYNNTVTGYSGRVHFTSSDSQAVLPDDSTLNSGTGTFSATLKTPGTRSITATDTVDNTITGTQSGITVNPVPVTNSGNGAAANQGGILYTIPAPVTVPVNLNGTQASLSLSTSVAAEQAVNISSPDKNLDLTIPSGTVVEVGGGAPTSVTITPQSSPPDPPQNKNFLGMPYSCQPSRLYFDPPVTLTWHIGALPAGVSPAEVEVGYYDKTSGDWVTVPAAYDTETGDITATIFHFTDYAVIIPEAKTSPSPSSAPAPVTPAATATTASSQPAATAPPASAISPPPTSTSNWGLIGGIIAAIIVIILIIWAVIRRRKRTA